MKSVVIFLVLVGFLMLSLNSVSATHDPEQSRPHSIILPSDMKEKTLEEFMEWCTPYYGERCPKLYEKNNVSSVLPVLKQFNSGISFDEIQCRKDLILIQKYDGSPACVKQGTAQELLERGWATVTTKPAATISKDSPDTTGVDFTKIVDANNKFALDFYSKISQQDHGRNNIFFSPTSISTAFSILYEGAREDTAKEIQDVFGFPEDERERRYGYSSLHYSINERNSIDGKNARLHIANALWLAENFEPLQEYTDTATTHYDSTVSVVDFVSDDGVNRINDWVKSKTEEKIEKLLEPGSTGPNTRMAITNAIYFKGMWEHPFNSEDTYETDFAVTQDRTVKVQMMTYPHKMQINTALTEQIMMLELPYKNNTMSMLILLPNEMGKTTRQDGLKSVEDSLTLENLEKWKDMLGKRGSGVVIHLPKFSLETNYNLKKVLPGMGMPSAFDPADADLSGISGYRGLYVSKAIHKAFVDVNEEGTEVAGATAIVTDESGGLEFKADRPFIFIIQDKETNSILFIGKVVDPTV